ncbi:MAG TPA: hypothetical protein VLI07_01370 [Candidatus Binatus sp.]|nr:hypothetical protein [Candidatus Binatus sp.]
MHPRTLGALLFGPLLGVATVWGAPGDVDSSFGSKGFARAPFEGFAFGQVVARQPDGKLVTAGAASPPNKITQVALARFQLDGTPDPSFGTGGITSTPVGSSTPQARSILVQDDGKLVVVGFLSSPGDDSVFLARYDAQGNLDGSFGTGGIAVAMPPGGFQATNAILEPDGKIVVATSAGGDALILRYGTDGTLDGTFGAGGVATVDLGGVSDRAAALALEPGGDLVLLGAAVDPGTSDIALARLDGSGALDPTFGTGGISRHDIGSLAPPVSLARLGDGKLFVSAGGYAGTPVQFTGEYFLRLDASGALDPTFGTGGVLADASEYAVLALAPTSDGTFVGISSGDYSLVLQRFAADGSLDPTFGDGGEVETQIGLLGGYPSGVLVEPDGKVAVTGVEYAPCEPMNCDMTYDIAYHSFLFRFVGGVAPCITNADCGPCESCGVASACVFGPRLSCPHATGGAKINIQYDPFSGDLDGYRIRLSWRGATPLGFDPVTTDDVGFCLYLEGKRALRAIAPAAGTCAGVPCWRGNAGSFLYRDRDRSPDGIATLKLRSSGASVDASGANLASSMHGVVAPSSPEVLSLSSILAEVHGGNGQCLQATLSNFERKEKPIAPHTWAIVGMRGVGY